MSVVANLGMSTSFAAINLEKLMKQLPATMRIDYIRIYQNEDDKDQVLSCDPPDYPTTDYIRKHLKAYTNPNLTDWKSTGYEWPKNSFMNDCSS